MVRYRTDGEQLMNIKQLVKKKEYIDYTKRAKKLESIS